MNNIPKEYYESKYWIKNDKNVLVSFKVNERGACKTLSKKTFGIKGKKEIFVLPFKGAFFL